MSLNKHGGDEGTRYRTGVYYEDERDYLDKTPGGYCHLSPEMFKLAAKYKKK